VAGSASPPELVLYRIAGPGYPVFDGGGAMRQAGRWTTPPRRVINCAGSYALALLENLVHWNMLKLPPGMKHVRCALPAEVSREALDPKALPGWDRPDYSVSQPFGNGWYDAARSCALILPSVLSPYEPNILINQAHPEFARLTPEPELPTVIDRRLMVTGKP
jgi:RES domain-containing protein